MSRAKRNKLRVTLVRLNIVKVSCGRKMWLEVQRSNGTTTIETFTNPRGTGRWWSEVVESFPGTTKRVLRLRKHNNRFSEEFARPFTRRCEIPLYNQLATQKTRFWLTGEQMEAKLAKYGKSLN